MLFAIFAVARRARRRRRPDYPHFSDTRQQLLHARTAPNGKSASRPIPLELILKRIVWCRMFGTTPSFSLPPSRTACETTLNSCGANEGNFQCHSRMALAPEADAGLTVYRLLQWGCIVTESQLRTTTKQNTGAIRSLSQKYNATTFKKRWLLRGANTYCNDRHCREAPSRRRTAQAQRF
jgi:hypothetical protein